MHIYCDTPASRLFVETDSTADDISVSYCGAPVDCPLIRSEKTENGFLHIFDSSALAAWSPDSPVLYTLSCRDTSERFGNVSYGTFGNRAVLLNGNAVYIRGYIRGIPAHDHPNMTLGTLYDAAVKNIKQAKKYGFNAVRFHSTVPTPEFVRAADELGMLIHMEIGFAFEYDKDGNKTGLAMDNAAWRETILSYRNHPSVMIFCIGNEMHNSGRYPEVKRLYDIGRALAPGKLIMDNSGWGEFDRESADIYSQHIAYFFPYGPHRDMFETDAPWYLNGAVSGEELDVDRGAAHTHRVCTPIRPVISHEAMHYIDIPDYEALGRKFDAFIANAGRDYLEANGIERPWYIAELEALIKRKGLSEKMPDLIAGSRYFKLLATRVFLERLRLSGLCGFEMLQLSDCFRYENKNGIIDCFDDDKGIDPLWLRRFNDDLVLVCDTERAAVYEGETVSFAVYASDFLAKPYLRGKLTLYFDGGVIYECADTALAGGLQKLCVTDIAVPQSGSACVHCFEAEFACGDIKVKNDCRVWGYPRASAPACREVSVSDTSLADFVPQSDTASDVYFTDTLGEEVLERLSEGRTVVLAYEYKAPRNRWQLPGALERFKPCIWDRGSNLGGVIYHEGVRSALAAGRYFDLEMQPLLEAGWKVNLDHFPFAVEEHIIGIDKPVRARMKGLIHKIGDFIDDDTLRRFAHLFSVRVGKGLLIVSAFNLSDAARHPVKASYLSFLLGNTARFDTDKSVSVNEFRAALETLAGYIQPEDTMNHFWELDNKPVEDTLFWEEAGISLADLN